VGAGRGEGVDLSRSGSRCHGGPSTRHGCEQHSFLTMVTALIAAAAQHAVARGARVTAALEDGNCFACVSLGGALPRVWPLGGRGRSLLHTKRDNITAQPPNVAAVLGAAPYDAYLATTVDCGLIFVFVLVGGVMRLCG